MTLGGCAGSESTEESEQQQSSQAESAGNEEETKASDADATGLEGMGDLLSAAYVDMMKANQYYMKYKGTVEYGGQSMELEAAVAVKGEDMAMTSSTQGIESNIVIKDGMVYMVDHAGKTVTTWAQMEGEEAIPMDSGTIDTEGIAYIGSGKEDGLVYEEYSTALDGKVKYYFDREGSGQDRLYVGGQHHDHGNS
jgi:hypothetical protein